MLKGVVVLFCSGFSVCKERDDIPSLSEEEGTV